MRSASYAAQHSLMHCSVHHYDYGALTDTPAKILSRTLPYVTAYQKCCAAFWCTFMQQDAAWLMPRGFYRVASLLMLYMWQYGIFIRAHKPVKLCAAFATLIQQNAAHRSSLASFLVCLNSCSVPELYACEARRARSVRARRAMGYSNLNSWQFNPINMTTLKTVPIRAGYFSDYFWTILESRAGLLFTRPKIDKCKKY